MSIGRSALALSAFISSTLTDNFCADFFIGISKVEPIFNLESVTMALDNSRPEKRFTLLLVKLAKANVIALDPRLPSAELARDVRQRLLKLLETRRYVVLLQIFGIINDLLFRESLDSLLDACFIYADAISCMQLGGGDGVAFIHIAKTIYFLTILFLRSIYDLHSQVYSFDLRIQRHINIVLSVFTNWLDHTLSRCICRCNRLHAANTALLEIGCSYYSLFAASVYRFNWHVIYH